MRVDCKPPCARRPEHRKGGPQRLKILWVVTHSKRTAVQKQLPQAGSARWGAMKNPWECHLQAWHCRGPERASNLARLQLWAGHVLEPGIKFLRHLVAAELLQQHVQR